MLIANATEVLRHRFAEVVRVPGSHEQWVRPGAPVQLREVSVGRPRERRRHGHPHGLSRRIAPSESAEFGSAR